MKPAGNPLDLRAWLATARQLGELKDVHGADWHLELGAISELNVKIDAAPALLFDDIKGYPNGFRVLTCSTASPARLSSLLRLGERCESLWRWGTWFKRCCINSALFR